ncbi:MAG: hypothetical protein FJ206_11670 [Gemmatimonadetes bacterium]|nr:hypothetical protein [Gemmatimonadota bacterium]
MERRRFLTSLAATAVTPGVGLLRPAVAAAPRRLPPADPSVELSDEAMGWLAHLDRKVSLGGTWHKEDIVGPQWDTTSFAPTMQYARYELTWLSWSMGLMAETTPAWREEYAKILGFLGDRYLEYWSFWEWIEHRGDDPGRGAYPAAFERIIPEGWWGRYNLPGWAGNGSQGEPFDPDPIRAAGRYGLMYKGYLNLVLSMYGYVADDGKYERPFTIRYDDAHQWRHTQRGLNRLLADQWRAHEEGIACEVAKVYPWCNALSGAGVLLYDQLSGTRFSEPYFQWQRYYATHFVGPAAGAPEWLMGYYDPINRIGLSDVKDGNGGNWMPTAWHGLAADPTLFEPLARGAMKRFYRGQPDGSGYFSMRGNGDVDLNIVTGLGAAIAAELGDSERHRAALEWIRARYQPRWDRDRGEFAFGFGLGEEWPRGQMNAWVMPALLVRYPGQWRRIFQAPNTVKFREPTLEGVDFPTWRIRRARFDGARRTLNVVTTTASPLHRGRPTTARVTRLAPGSRVTVVIDESPGVEMRADAGSVTIETTVDDHRIDVHLG